MSRPATGRISAGHHSARWIRDEAGWTTPLALLFLSIVLLVSGLAVDTANLHRNRQMMQGTADIAAHAGVTVLARGADQTTARRTAMAAVEKNLPQTVFGPLIGDPAHDILVVHYDSETKRMATSGPANAVYTRLQRNNRTANPVRTFFLHFAGISSLDAEAASLAALVPTRRCSNAEGLYAFGAIAAGYHSRPMGGLCMHSQDRIELAPDQRLSENVQLSIPRITPNTAPDIELHAALTETNLIMPEPQFHLARLFSAIASPGMAHPAKAAFFANHRLDSDLSALQNRGVRTWQLETGSVLEMSPLIFSQLGRPPRGLVYVVSCAAAEADAPAWEKELVLRHDKHGNQPDLSGLALITTCPIVVEPGTVIEDALILSLKPADGRPVITIAPESSPLIDSSDPDVSRLGAPTYHCTRTEGTFLFANDALELDVSMIGGGLTLISGRDVAVTQEEGSRTWLFPGLTIHAGGRITLADGISIEGCGRPSSPLLPALNVIAHVMTTADALPRSTPRISADQKMPGQRVSGLRPVE